MRCAASVYCLLTIRGSVLVLCHGVHIRAIEWFSIQVPVRGMLLGPYYEYCFFDHHHDLKKTTICVLILGTNSGGHLGTSHFIGTVTIKCEVPEMTSRRVPLLGTTRCAPNRVSTSAAEAHGRRTHCRRSVTS